MGAALDVAAVDPRAVGRAEVGDRPAVRPGADLGVLARDVGVVDDHVALTAAPDRRALGPDDVALAADDDHAAAGLRHARLGELLAHAVRRRVDHRVPVVGLLDRRAVGAGTYEPRLHAELPERERRVGAELDARAAHEGEALTPGMLEQVPRELADDLVLDGLEARAVIWAEVDEVLIGDVGLAERHRAVL